MPFFAAHSAFSLHAGLVCPAIFAAFGRASLMAMEK
jgi:hypothetical protein